ncbi:MAG: caspase family protein [Saprospiraceae bacterium]|nr:caspase family protein [Saprospiraceae bacterium]
MKQFLLLLLLLPFHGNSQTEKSITPLPPPPSGGQGGGAVRAVVVGISDYQDPAIPDLRFADRDAEAFANFLRSPAGGSMTNEQMTLLTNKDATTGKMIAALDWLISASQPGDEAIIYFSGHGDVEQVTKFQRGYWLSWDSPPAVYPAGAFSLDFLQDIITTLSENNVQVLVVSDACRAGKLAGSKLGGAKATSAALAQQFANEVKVLSCQPEEFSLEGEQWGGGRGAFSYHLVDALYGMADANADGTVNLLELGRYLEDRVPAETAPHAQIPFTVGRKSAKIATVNAPVFAEWKKRRKDDPTTFSKIETKGLEELVLARVDTGIQEMYARFIAALERGDLLEAVDSTHKSANELYEVLIKEPALASLHGAMTRNFAAALMDEGQNIINQLLKTDHSTINNAWAQPVKFDHIPDLLNRAATLLGEHHYVYRSLKAKEYYFLEKKMRQEVYPNLSLDSIYSRKRELLWKGLTFDSTAAYLWESLWYNHRKRGKEIFIHKALEISPNWALAHFELADWYIVELKDNKAAVEHLKKCIELAPDFTITYNEISWPLDALGEFEEANKYRSLYVDNIKEKWQKDSSSVTILELQVLGNALWQLRRYNESVTASKKVIAKTQGNYVGPFGNLLAALADQGKFEEWLETCEKFCTLTKWCWTESAGDICFFYLHDTIRSENWYNKSLVANPFIARFYMNIGRPQKSLEILQKFDCSYPSCLFQKVETLLVSDRKPDTYEILDTIIARTNPVYLNGQREAPDFVYRCIAFYRLGRMQAFQACIRQAMKHPDGWRFYWLACIYAQTVQLQKAIEYLELAEDNGWIPNPVIWVEGTVNDPLLDPLRHLPAFQDWEKRWSPPYKDHSKN